MELDGVELSAPKVTGDPRFETAFATWLASAQKIIDDHHREHFSVLEREILVPDRGKKYIRVWKRRETETTSRGSAHCFIDMTTGDILRPATWKAPAKHARGNVFDANNGLGSMGPYGAAYLR